MKKTTTRRPKPMPRPLDADKLAGVTGGIVSPRDSSSGLPTG